MVDEEGEGEGEGAALGVGAALGGDVEEVGEGESSGHSEVLVEEEEGMHLAGRAVWRF